MTTPLPLGTIVGAGSLAIEIARLRVELRRHLSEVESSRARIIAAGHTERRRIERDLHDGAQQRLVSIGLELRHAQHQLGRYVSWPAARRSPSSYAPAPSATTSRWRPPPTSSPARD
jgi:signal transduction histidine kinase